MKKILIHLILGYVLVYLVACSNNDSENDFNLICGYFYSLGQRKSAGKNPSSDFEFINDRIKANIPSDHVANFIWSSALLMTPQERYLLFREAAKEELKKTWQCAAMEELLKDFEMQ